MTILNITYILLRINHFNPVCIDKPDKLNTDDVTYFTINSNVHRI